MNKLAVQLGNLKLDNPIIPASGTFGYGEEYNNFYDINVLGSLCTKGTTLHPRHGNKSPRISECTAGMINSVGLQNPGLAHVLEHEMPRLAEIFHKPVIANIGGFTVEEFVECAQKLEKCENVGILEINISCPNLHESGKNFASSPETAALVTREVKAATKKPVYMKLSPNVADITEIAKACEKAGADGLSLINTIMGMRINQRTGKPFLGNIAGGVSGKCILPMALWMVYQVYKTVDIPIMGVGGVSSAWTVIEMMMAGATAVQIGAENLRNPFACKEILDELPIAMEDLRIDKLTDIIGKAHR